MVWLNRQQKEKKLLLLREKRIREARGSFWEFCKLIHPEFFKENRTYLKTICNVMQGIYEGTILKEDGNPFKKMILSVPP